MFRKDNFIDKYVLPNYEDIERILSKYPCFFKREYEIDGNKVYLYGYHFMQNEAYMNQEDLLSYEMRSLVYCVNENKFYLGMSKMFEFDSIPENLEDYYITDKIDGSLIIPLVLNDKIYLRSKNKFFSEHSSYAENLLDYRYDSMIKDLFSDGYIPYFELVSSKYKVVVNYDQEVLFLTQIRSNNSGVYLDYEEIEKIAKYYDIPVAKPFNLSKSEMLDKIKNEKNIEGWVLVRKNNSGYLDSFKVKTDWYKKIHYLTFEPKEHNIIKAFLTGDIPPDIENDPKILNITSKISHYIENSYKDILNLLNSYSHLDRKSFYESVKSHEYVSIIMKFYGKKYSDYEIKKFLIEEILKKTNTYTKALEFLERI